LVRNSQSVDAEKNVSAVNMTLKTHPIKHPTGRGAFWTS